MSRQNESSDGKGVTIIARRKCDIPSNACSTFIASFALVSKYGIPPLDWQKVIARLDEIWKEFLVIRKPKKKRGFAYHALILLHVNFISKYDLDRQSALILIDG
jgi:hypothetical protein